MNKESIYLSVVLYTHNNETEIQDFLLKLDTVISIFFESFDIAIINDASSDNTVKKIMEINSSIKAELSIINLAWEHGVELSMLAGTDAAIGDYIIEIENLDFNYPDDIFQRMYKYAAEKGLDVVTASGKYFSRITSRIFYNVLSILSYSKIKLKTEQLRLVTRRAINKVNCDKKRVRYRKINYQYSGFLFGNIEYNEIKKTKYTNGSGKNRIANALEILIVFTDIGTKVSGLLSSIFLTFSLSLGIYALYVYFTTKNIASGWTTLMVFLSLGFSGIFIILTIIGKYMSIILTEVQQSRPYTIRSIDRISHAK